MRKYAVIARLPRRVIVPVPVLSPWLSAQWVNLVTPVPRSIAVPLMESLIHEVICEGDVVACRSTMTWRPATANLQQLSWPLGANRDLG